jgi:PII-like signaling protein
MLKPGHASKVTIHLNDDTSSNTSFIYEQVFQFLYDNGVAGATLSRPQAGFGGHHHSHTRGSYGAAGAHLPVEIQFIDSPEVVARLLPALCEMVQDGLIEMQETNVVQARKLGDAV